MMAADLFGPYVLRGLVDLVLATFTAFPIALAALVTYGLGTSSGAVTFNSLLQAHTPPEARGRVFASFDVGDRARSGTTPSWSGIHGECRYRRNRRHRGCRRVAGSASATCLQATVASLKGAVELGRVPHRYPGPAPMRSP
jgi:hypothetical protein